jgi:putative transposase
MRRSDVMQVRDRYRIYPSSEQQQMARTFGCTRVVYNDCLRLRNAYHAAGKEISDPEVQRQVVTLAKQTQERAWLGEVGDLKVAWSRALPSVPSSVNPRFLRAKERKLARAQRALSRKQKGSANRAKARLRLAVLHRKVRETRLDHAHKTALWLVRDNQAVYAEDLCVSGLARTRLARSVHDASWSQLLRLIEEKAAQYGRTFARIGRFEPTSQMCSACGVKDGPKPLRVRAWTCSACGATHDRDVNAAKNVLALGRRESLNACGGNVRPGLVPADLGETGTHRSAA